MSMIRGEIQLDREVVSRRLSVGGESPFRKEKGEWVNKGQSNAVIERITLADVLGRKAPDSNEPSEKLNRR